MIEFPNENLLQIVTIYSIVCLTHITSFMHRPLNGPISAPPNTTYISKAGIHCVQLPIVWNFFGSVTNKNSLQSNNNVSENKYTST